MATHTTVMLAALAAGLAAAPAAFAQPGESSGRSETVKDNYLGRNAQGSSGGATVFDVRHAPSPRKRTLEASGAAIAAALVAVAITAEERHRGR